MSLTADGRLRDDQADRPVRPSLALLALDVTAADADYGLPLRGTDLARRRLAGVDTVLIGYPNPHTDDPDDFAFLCGAPDTCQPIRPETAAKPRRSSHRARRPGL